MIQGRSVVQLLQHLTRLTRLHSEKNGRLTILTSLHLPPPELPEFLWHHGVTVILNLMSLCGVKP